MSKGLKISYDYESDLDALSKFMEHWIFIDKMNTEKHLKLLEGMRNRDLHMLFPMRDLSYPEFVSKHQSRGKVKFELTACHENHLKQFGDAIVFNDGREYYHDPCWYLKNSDGSYYRIKMDDLPCDVIEMINDLKANR